MVVISVGPMFIEEGTVDSSGMDRKHDLDHRQIQLGNVRFGGLRMVNEKEQ